MTSMMLAKKSVEESKDGRRARSESSRQRIVDAMMELIRGGDMNPSAARVAEEAGVGLRTVFRHFDDMDAIYAEISATISRQLMPIAMTPLTNEDWRDNIRDLARRRVQAYETMLPFRLAANMRRYSSPFLMGQYAQIVNFERELILRQFPDNVRSQHVTVEAICAALSFQNWYVLRHDQQLTAEDAGTITVHMVESLISAAK
jgi:AcrR family transcriptional regulator